MTDTTLFVGLDVHKKTILVAVVEAIAGAVRFYGTIANTPDSVRTLCRKLSRDGQQLHFAYEAVPCGCGVQRRLEADICREDKAAICVNLIEPTSPGFPGSKSLSVSGHASALCQADPA